MRLVCVIESATHFGTNQSRYLCVNEVDADGKPIGAQVAQWLLRWMAYPLQNPGAKMSTAVIMHGPQGTGKSAIFQVLASIYGKYATVLNQRGLEDKFNADWVDCKLFLLAEEVVTRAEMWHIKNELKELVTGKTVRVNGKNVSAYPQKNQINMALLSNENQPLPLDNDDRRHLVVYTPPSLSEEYYDEVHREIENGGVAAFYWHLLNLDLGDFHPKKRPPMTQSKSALISLVSLSLGPA
ncbi:primase-helicase family protein, partial [Candidatus Dactylopiibacterium carminicum]|uniref:primase-helicase family protein n=1 Tax=Candidatus Dactylopiibacterium carminicum TaxID=857335 RepID=UPI001CC2CE6F